MSEGERPLRVLVAGRHPVVRAGLRGLLANHDDIEVVGESMAADDLDALAVAVQAEVILLEWPDAAPTDNAWASFADSNVPIVLMGAVTDDLGVSTLLAAGARGFLLQDASGDEVAEAAHAVAHGLVVLDASLAPSALSPNRPSIEDSDDDPLTEREHDVLELLAQGLPNKTIAQRLHISEHTVKFHVGSVLAKLGAASRTEAVALALRRGLLAL